MYSRYVLLVVPFLLLGCSELPSWMGGKAPVKPKLSGDRVEILPVAESYTADAALADLPVALPEAATNGDWPEHTAVVDAQSSNLMLRGVENEKSASVGEGDSFEHILIPRPVVAGGMVFAMDGTGHISAHAAENIDQVVWESDGLVEEDEPDVLGGGLTYHDGVLYAVSGRGAVGAFDAKTGAGKWRITLGIPLRSPPKISGEQLMAISIDNQLFALSTAKGDVLWTHRAVNETTGLMNNVSPLISGDRILTPYSSGDLFALSLGDGKEIWQESLLLPAALPSTAVTTGIGGDLVLDGQVVFAVSSGGLMGVFSLEDGKRAWVRPLSSHNTPWISGNFVYVLTADDVLLCMVKYDGRIRWATQLQSFEDMELRLDPIHWNDPVMANGKLVMVGSHGEMVWVDATTGAQVEHYDISDDIYTSPVIAGGRMYLIDKNATLHSFE